MRLAKFFALTLGVALMVVWSASGQPPPGGGFFPKDKDGKGFKGGKGAKGKADSDRLLDDLKVTVDQREKARDLLKAYDEKIRQATRQARTDLIDKMKDVLSDADFKVFKDELEQVPLLPPIPPGLRTIAADDLVERLMAYDKNKDGKVTKDELPERMHGLIEQGDTDGDGALSLAEIKALAAKLNRQNGPGGPGGRGGPGGPPGGPGGRPPFPPPPKE
jgi:EF hand